MSKEKNAVDDIPLEEEDFFSKEEPIGFIDFDSLYPSVLGNFSRYEPSLRVKYVWRCPAIGCINEALLVRYTAEQIGSELCDDCWYRRTDLVGWIED